MDDTMAPTQAPQPVLELQDLAISYQTRRGAVPAVRGVSFGVCRGETVGVVGESGCGKSTLAFSVVGFLGPNGRVVDGGIRFEGQSLVGKSREELRRIRGDRIGMVYQDPMQALNPSMRLGEQLAEVLTCHRDVSREEAWERSAQMLARIHMPDPSDVMRRYPHQISGGQQQRVVIAMAMLNDPALLILDEPTTALDVTVEAAVLDLLQELKQEFDSGILFITHNLGVVARISDRLCVMYAGELVEEGATRDIFAAPSHPYTRGLLRCVPRLGASKTELLLEPIRGRVPPPAERPEDACVFAPRCQHAAERCSQARPGLEAVTADHRSRCFYAAEVRASIAPRQRPPAAPTEASDQPVEPLLTARDLRIYYEQGSGSLRSLFGLGEKRFVKAVDGVSLEVARGHALGIVGESGCGKSSLVKGLIGLEEIHGGDGEFLGLDLADPLPQRSLDFIREVQMVFQNPDSTLNPSYSVGSQIARPLRRFGTVPKNRVRAEVVRLLQAVKLDAHYYDRLPRQLSGGEKQRVGIARALASRPDLVLCDEPVSALDVSVQAAVLNLLMEIQARFGATLIFIAHDLSVVRFFCDEVAVMYLGQVVEFGPAECIYAPPYHPYSEALLSAVPVPDPAAEARAIRLEGPVPSSLDPPSGCRFHTRCPRRGMLPDAGAVCEREAPPWRHTPTGHRILCHIPLDELEALGGVFDAA
jgi:peptide/nickel transport system ATP-binding protein